MPTIQLLLRPSVPDLISVDVGTSGGDNCTGGGNWIGILSWITTNPNDTLYQIDIDASTEQTPSSFSSIITGQTTSTSSYNDDTGLTGNTGGSNDPVTHWRTYRVKLVRKSDSAVMEQVDTGTISITFFSDACV